MVESYMKVNISVNLTQEGSVSNNQPDKFRSLMEKIIAAKMAG